MKKKILLGMMAVALMSLMTVNVVYACVGPGLSPGFWKHNVGVYLELKNGKYSDPGYTGGIVTKATMGDWLDANWDDTVLLDLFNALNTKGGGAVGAEIRVNAANVFNAAADLYPYED